MQLAAKAVKMMQEQQAQPNENTPADKSPSVAVQPTSDQQIGMVKEQPTEPGCAPSLDIETRPTDIPTEAAQHTTTVNSERPDLAAAIHILPGPNAFRALKRSASMPALPTVSTADNQHDGNMPTAIVAQFVSQTDIGRNKAKQVTKAEPATNCQRTAVQKQLAAAIPHAADQSHLHASHSVPIAMLPHWAAAASAVASAADSTMSNSPKESTASIVLANPFAVSTNIHPNLGLGAAPAVPQSYLYTEAALRSSLTSSAGNRQLGGASLFAHNEKENSPKPRSETGVMQSNALAIFGSRAGALDIAGKLQNVFTNRSSGRNSAMSGTASGHALSAKNRTSGASLMQAGSVAGAGPESVSKPSAVLHNAEYQHAGNAVHKRVKLT